MPALADTKQVESLLKISLLALNFTVIREVKSLIGVPLHPHQDG